MDAPPMTCPACQSPRIGNRRASCRICNAFAQQVIRETQRRLRLNHAAEYDTIRAEVEAVLYDAYVVEGVS